MKRKRLHLAPRKLLSFLLMPLVVVLALNLAPHLSVETKQSTDYSILTDQFAQLPLAFEPNEGQVDGAVQYLVHHGQATTYFTGAETVTSIGGERISMSLAGAANASFVGTDELSSKTNYFIGNDQSKWQSNVSNYQSILAQNVYPGIDLKYYGTNSQLEHDFIVAPGVDPKQILFRLAGQRDLSLDPKGNLVLKLNESEVMLRAPVSYQENENGGRGAVMSSYELHGDGRIRIALGEYDSSRTLVIDPILSPVYATPIGGSSLERAHRMELALDGTAYITGETSSTDFPTSSSYQGSNAGGVDTFVSVFSPDGQTLLYSTYLGGSGDDYGYGIDVDGSGNIYVAGQTDSGDFPTVNPYYGAFAGDADVFVTKIDSSGASLTYSTYLGGVSVDSPTSLSVDVDGNAYVAGFTQSSDYPLQDPYESGFDNTMAFATKLAPDGQSLIYSTYLGNVGDTIDIAYCAAIDDDGSFYLAGSTTSQGNVFNTNAYQGTHAGGIWDMFLTKFAPDGQSLEYSTYIGGTDDEGGYVGCGITVDGDESPYITGTTRSTDFPTNLPYQASHAGGTDDAFVLQFAPDGQSLEYSTFLGGSSGDNGVDIEVDPAGVMYVATSTSSTDFPIVSPWYQDTYGGFIDTALTKIAADGQSLEYSTYFRSTDVDYPSAIDLDLNGDLYVAGYVESDPVLYNPYQVGVAGGGDAYIAQLTLNSVVVTGIADPALSFSVSSTLCDLGIFSATQTKFCNFTLTAATNAPGGYVISYAATPTITSGGDTITAMASQAASVITSEQFGFNLKANTAAGSFTATDFGADPTGGSGVAMTGYELANQFKFDVAGADIAQSATASNPTAFTASFIANIEYATEPGTYSTPVTYTIVATY